MGKGTFCPPNTDPYRKENGKNLPTRGRPFGTQFARAHKTSEKKAGNPKRSSRVFPGGKRASDKKKKIKKS